MIAAPLEVPSAEAEFLERLAAGLDPAATDERTRADAARLEASLRAFVAAAWHVVEPRAPFVPGWHIDAVCEHLQAVARGEINRLVVNIPPRHTKSLVTSVFLPAWIWTHTPHARFLCSSYAQSLATRDSVKTRRVIQSRWYRERWGDGFHLTSDQNLKMRFENDRTGYRIATGVGGSSTGEGGDFIIVDDPHNVKHAESDAKRTEVIDWWSGVMSSRLNDPKAGGRIIIGQRCHAGDLFGHVLGGGGWEHLCLPGEYEPARGCVTALGRQDPRTEDGEALCPARFPAGTLEKLQRDMGSYKYAAQVQQRPAPRGGGILKRAWWRRYPDDPAELARSMDELVQSWDAAFKDLATSSYVVGQVWGLLGARKYLLAQVRGHWDLPETIRQVLALTLNWRDARTKLIEDKANGPAVMQTLAGKITGLKAVAPAGSKEARAAATSPTVEAGDVYIPEDSRAPWIEGFIEECEMFPRAPNDDQVDAATQAITYLDALALRRLAEGVAAEGSRRISHWTGV